MYDFKDVVMFWVNFTNPECFKANTKKKKNTYIAVVPINILIFTVIDRVVVSNNRNYSRYHIVIKIFINRRKIITLLSSVVHLPRWRVLLAMRVCFRRTISNPQFRRSLVRSTCFSICLAGVFSTYSWPLWTLAMHKTRTL